jgi:hypothetical protein
LADNVQLSAGTADGAVIATDDITSVHYPINKQAFGALNSATLASAGAGAVDGGVQRMTLASDDPAVTALQLIDNAIAGTEMQVDVVAALPAGTNNIGDVDVLSVIPGVGATNLGKAIGDVAGATDTGVVALGVLAHTDALSHTGNADGDYDRLSLTEYRELRTRDQRVIVLDRMDATTGWSALNDDAVNLATSTNHVYGTNSLTFDKANGTANTVYAMIQKTLSSISIHDIIAEGGYVGISAYLPSLTNVVNVVMRLGTSAAAYQEWTWAVADLTAARWLPLRANIMQPSSVTGNGWTTEDIDYVAIGVQFSGETNTLAGIIMDRCVLIGGRVTDGTLNATISSSVSTPNINMQRIGSGGGSIVSVSSGATDSGTQRVVLATDVALPAGTNGIGKLTANSGVDIGDVDVTSIVPGTGATNLGKAEDAGHTSGDTGVYVLAVRDDALAAHSGADGDYESFHTDAAGALWSRNKPPDVDVTIHTNYAKKYYTNAGAVTDGIIWSPAANTRWHVCALYIQVSAAATVTLEDDKAGGDEVVFKSEFAANSGCFLTFPDKYPLASGEDAADLLITTSAGNVYVTVTGYEI